MPIQKFYFYCRKKELLANDAIAYISLLEQAQKNISLISFLDNIYSTYMHEYRSTDGSTLHTSRAYFDLKIKICADVICIHNGTLKPSQTIEDQEHYEVKKFLLHLTQNKIPICNAIICYCTDLIADIHTLKPFFKLSTSTNSHTRQIQDSDDIFRVFGSAPDRILIARNSIFQPRLSSYMIGINKRDLLLDTTTPQNIDDETLIWARDPMITTYAGLAVSVFHNTQYAFEQHRDTYIRPLDPHHIYPKYQHFVLQNSDEYVMSSTVPYLTSLEQVAFKNYNIQTHLAHNFNIAGGNVIKAYNKTGELIYIVGLAAVLTLMEINYHSTDHPRMKQSTLTQKQMLRVHTPIEQEYYLSFKNAKRLVRYFLIGNPEDETKRVIFVDHGSYHIDLDALYVAPGIMLVNSYSQFIEQLQSINDQCFSWPESPNILFNKSNYIWYFSQMKLRYETQLNRLSEQLKKRGFDVYRIAGSSLHVSKHNPINDSPLYNTESMQDFRRKIAFCYLNGIVCQSSENNYDILIPASYQESCDKTLQGFFLFNFIRLIRTIFEKKKESKRVICIGVSRTSNLYPNNRGGVITTPEEFMLLSEGGLRCSVNKIPDSFIENQPCATSAPEDVQ